MRGSTRSVGTLVWRGLAAVYTVCALLTLWFIPASAHGGLGIEPDALSAVPAMLLALPWSLLLGLLAETHSRAAAAGLLLVQGMAHAAEPAKPAPAVLPFDAARLIVQDQPGADTRVFAAPSDLDGDGRDEWLAYLAGPSACGTGGCPLYVLAPSARGYRVLARIGPVQAPVHVAAAPGRPWRDLIVTVGGGGRPWGSVQLSFDGRSYARNPTISGPRSRPAKEPQHAPAVADFQDFKDGAPLPTAAELAALPAGLCAPADGSLARAIHQHAELRSLARAVTSACERSQPTWAGLPPGTLRDVLAQQRSLSDQRQACARQRDPRPCLGDVLARQQVVLRIGLGEMGDVPAAVAYRCAAQPSVSVQMVFYPHAEPRAAVLTVGDRQRVLFAEPSGSGARYAAAGVQFWEYHGQATLEGLGPTLTCEARQRP